MPHDEQVRASSFPLSARAILQAVSAFERQFHTPCSLYIQGSLLLSTGERCLAPDWLPVARPEPELDLLGIGDPDLCTQDDLLTWVAPTDATTLLLSSCKLDP